MAYFDFLIEKGIEPKVDVEYIYLHDLVWKKGELDATKIKKGTIVHQVSQRDNGSYEFSIDGMEGRFRCNYSWAFAERTDENIERIKAFDECVKRIEELEAVRKLLSKEIKTLKTYPENE